jgi:hypothetical protein
MGREILPYDNQARFVAHGILQRFADRVAVIY